MQTGRFAIMDGATVVNVAEATPDYAAAQGWIPAGKAGPGWTKQGAAFIPPADAPAPVELTKAQLVAAIDYLGAQVMAIKGKVEAMPIQQAEVKGG
jgi:hypothetical protein